MSHSKNGYSRRSFLRGLGGVTVGLPLLNSLGACSGAREVGKATKALESAPPRILFFFSPNGTIRESWRPTGSETNFELSPILSPLEDYKEKLIVIDGLDMLSSQSGPGDAHQKGMGHILTGTALQEGDLFTGGNGEAAGWGGGISVDQRIAQAIGADHPFGSLEFGVQVGSPNIWSRMSYAGPGQPVPPENSPYANFDRIFADLSVDPATLDSIRARRGTVLDFVNDDFKRLQDRVSTADKQHLERHATSIRDIEQRLGNIADIGEQCAPPELGVPMSLELRENYPAIGKLQMDLAAMSFACNLTRVASIQFSNAVGNHIHTWLGQNRGHHDYSHDGNSITATQQALVEINHWYAQQFAYLLEKLDSIPEGDGGTVLDNTVVVWVNELGRGNSHSRDNIPVVMAGGAGGKFQTGRYLKYFSESHNNLLISLQNAFGIEDTVFGDPAYCSGALAGL
tara:strand:- start:3173 stop:4540 length:1368 start_codon:yes stop_codon:yes gene_type:complete